MCGISLIIEKNPDQQNLEERLHAMVKAQAHRGPDGSAVWVETWSQERILAGHNLLAISEVAQKAAQPFLSEDGECGLVFNGQIYNHLRLRDELVAEGESFQTQSDTETLLKWLRCKGRRGLARLEGMYAFAFWDSSKELLILHRDPFGIKPLYMARSRNFLAFSSEPQGLLASRLLPFEPNKIALPAMLRYKWIPAPLSAWQGMIQLKPGEVIEYWEGKPMHYQVPVPALAENGSIGLEEAMNQAFDAVIPSDETFALSLSGGVDSSLLLEWCLRNKKPVRVYAIRYSFESQLNADQEAVSLLARRLGFPVRWVDVSDSDVDQVAGFFTGKENPVADTAWLLTSAIAKTVREDGLRILLSGAGADEWFAGYRRHRFFEKAARWISFLPPAFSQRVGSGNLPGKWKWLYLDSAKPGAIWNALISSKTKGLLPDSCPELPSQVNSLEEALNWDQQHYLPGDILAMTDAATMAWGVEGRFPFLHPALVRFAEAIPAGQRLGSAGKVHLKNLLDERLGFSFSQRKKQGFGLPLAVWFRTHVDYYGKAIGFLQEEGILLKNDRSEGWLLEVQAHPENFSQELLAICWLADWLKASKESKAG
jgi:asparagine synthase (glutamine-hydrolysing)